MRKPSIWLVRGDLDVQAFVAARVRLCEITHAVYRAELLGDAPNNCKTVRADRQENLSV